MVLLDFTTVLHTILNYFASRKKIENLANKKQTNKNNGQTKIEKHSKITNHPIDTKLKVKTLKKIWRISLSLSKY